MRKGRSISITMQGYVVRENPRWTRNHFDYGCGIWNGEQFDCVSVFEMKASEIAEYEALEGRPIPPRVTRIEFSPVCPALPDAVVSFGRAKDGRRLLERLEKDEAYRHQRRRLDGQKVH